MVEALLADRFLLIVLALIIDFIAGDPVYSLHPARISGNVAGFVEHLLFRIGLNGYTGGLIYWLVVFCATGGIFLIPVFILESYSHLFASFYKLFVFYSFISVKDMKLHAIRVYSALKVENLSQARAELSNIVGRDTENMDSSDISRACIESVAESSNDGITAPLLFCVLFGVPGIVLYKAINTMDSMVGYKNQRYKKFGFVSANMDDIANFIPSRINLFLILLVSGTFDRRSLMAFRDSRKHTSPNSGWSESGFAHVLGIWLGGNSFYKGMEVEKPHINPTGREAVTDDIKRAVLLMYKNVIPYYIILPVLTVQGVWL